MTDNKIKANKFLVKDTLISLKMQKSL